jgi:hypothetical protein
MTQPNAALSYHIGDVVTLMDSTTGKNLLRPALVLADTGDDDIVIARITTHQTRDSSDVNIRNWSIRTFSKWHRALLVRKNRHSRESGSPEVLVAGALDSRLRGNDGRTLKRPCWSIAGLDRQSVARPHKLATIAKRLVRQKVGSLSFVDLQEVRTSFGLLGI